MNDFYGRPTLTLESEHLRLDVLAEAGPRIVRLMLPGSDENLLVEVPDMGWETEFGRYDLLGGHRLWHSPEAMPRTYIPDSSGVTVTRTAHSLQLCGQTEPGTGIQKTIEVALDHERPAVTVHHRLENHGMWPVELAPWAITQMPLGGLAVLPQPVGPADESGLLPNRHLALWSYTRWDDPRLHLADDFITVEGGAVMPPMKVGYFNPAGWLAYFRAGTLFVKRAAVQTGQPYPDFGCSSEVYCNDYFIELETLGPLVTLAPGESVDHDEVWEIYPDVAQPTLENFREALAGVGMR